MRRAWFNMICVSSIPVLENNSTLLINEGTYYLRILHAICSLSVIYLFCIFEKLNQTNLDMKLKQLIFGAIILLILIVLTFKFFDFTNSDVKDCFYPTSIIEGIIDSEQYDVRFYNTMYPSGSAQSLMAVSVLNGADLNGSSYFLFETIKSDIAVIASLTKQEARVGCSNLTREERFAVTFENDTLLAMLRIPGATGIYLEEALDSSGNKTLIAFPATIINGSIEIIPGARGQKNQQPCPTYCGVNRTLDYLCPM